MEFAMQTLDNFQYRGKKAKIGGFCFDKNDKLNIFVTYCEKCNGKIVITREEACYFAKRYNYEQNKLRTRLAKRLLNKY